MFPRTPRRGPLPAWVAVAAIVALSGCFGPEARPVFTAEGSMPVVFVGYDHNGTTAAPGQGSFRVATDAAADTGTVTANFTHAGGEWRVDFARFTAAAPHQEGGIRANFRAHGASGAGDASLPEFTALSAGWGSGTVTVNGAPFVDPATGSAEFDLEYFVAEGAVRDAATNKVTKADGATPYDPAAPQDARVAAAPPQFLLDIRGAGVPQPDAAFPFAGDLAPNYNRNHTFNVTGHGASIAVNVSVQPTTAPLPASGIVTFLLLDPAGQPQGRYEYAPSPQTVAGGNATFAVPAPAANGTWSLQVSGSAVGVSYAAEVAVDYPMPLFLHVVYHDVRVVQRGAP